uniref:Gypsy retrotransposon integrase-like protein 1 n=1 Tax=Sander lucioperca TaxID=283035 RepID=A0A8D0DEN8_SANLU
GPGVQVADEMQVWVVERSPPCNVARQPDRVRSGKQENRLQGRIQETPAENRLKQRDSRGLLYQVVKKNAEVHEQLLVPQPYRATVLNLAHTHPLGAHLGVEKTKERIMQRFFWPGVHKEIENYCRSCPECQQVAPKPTYKKTLIPLPIIETPFERIGLDIVGPLPKSSRGHQYILVILDYASRYPEAIPLRKATSRQIAKELFLLSTSLGIPKEILTDQGTPFMSRVMKELCVLLKIKQLRTSVYHPQTDGLVERFNKTLKSMLRKAVGEDGRNWDQLLPYILFAVREVPQSSTGFSPFELLLSYRPRGLLDIAKEAWEEQPCQRRTLIEHVGAMRERMKAIYPMMREHLEASQRQQQASYNRSAQPREFKSGDRVLVLVPTVECKFLTLVWVCEFWRDKLQAVLAAEEYERWGIITRRRKDLQAGLATGCSSY